MKSLISIVFITLSIITSTINSQCVDFQNPLEPSKRLYTKCPSTSYSPPNLKFQSGDNMFILNFTCGITNTALCNKAKGGFEAVGKTISAAITFKSQITVNAKFLPLDDIRILGAAGPSRLIPLTSDDGVKRLYPQALVRQFTLNNVPEFLPEDIDARFNSDANFWFEGDTTPISLTQPNFNTVILHEFFHGLGFVSSYSNALSEVLNQNGIASPTIVTPFPYFISETPPLVFGGFLETIFDKQVILTADNSTLTNTTAKFSAFAKSGTTFASDSDFITKFLQSPQNTLGLKLGSTTGVTPKSMLFVPTVPTKNTVKTPEGVYLETSLEPFRLGSSISHMDRITYTGSSDFLMRFALEPGVTTNDLITKGGNFTGGAIGPLLLQVMGSMGYTTVENPNPKIPTNTDTSTATNPTSASSSYKLMTNNYMFIVSILSITYIVSAIF